MKEKLTQVQVHLQEASSILSNLLAPHLKPQNVQLVKATSDIIANADFLFKILIDEALAEEVQELITASDHYTQFHFYPEK